MLEAILIFIAIGIMFIVFVPSKPIEELEDYESEDIEYNYYPKLSDDDIKGIALILIDRAKRSGYANLKDISKDKYGPMFYKSWQFSRIGHYMNGYTFNHRTNICDEYIINVVFEDQEMKIGVVLNVYVTRK